MKFKKILVGLVAGIFLLGGRVEGVALAQEYNQEFFEIKNNKIVGYNKITRKKEELDLDKLDQLFKTKPSLPVEKEYLNFYSRFGIRGSLDQARIHTGLDISQAGIDKTPVYSILDGRVVKLERTSGGYGNLVIIDHGGFTSYYAHLDSFREDLKLGDKVRRGEKLGRVGNTGRSTGPHLHLEINIGNLAINPELILDYYGDQLQFEPAEEIVEKIEEVEEMPLVEEGQGFIFDKELESEILFRHILAK